MRLKILAILVAAMAAAPATTEQATSLPAAGPTLVLGALQSEIAPIEKQLTDKKTQKVRGVKFITGSLSGRPVVLARTGAGKVNAAMVAALGIERFAPGEVIFTGIAGGISDRVRVGDVVIAVKTAQHDFGRVTDKGFQPRRELDKATSQEILVFTPADPVLLKAAQSAAERLELASLQTPQSPRQPVILTGVVVTGDVFIASSAKKSDLLGTFGADAVEMEGAAVAAVCHKLGVPCLVIRSVSDDADEQAEEIIKTYAKAAAENAAALTVATIQRLAAPAAVTTTSAPAMAPAGR